MTGVSPKNRIYENVDNGRKLLHTHKKAFLSCLRCGAGFDSFPPGVLHADHFCSASCEQQFAVEIIQAHLVEGIGGR